MYDRQNAFDLKMYSPYPFFGIEIPEVKKLASESTQKNIAMKTALLIKNIYRDAFESLGHFITKNFFKAFAWFSFGMFAVVVYAFIFRVITGYPFQ